MRTSDVDVVIVGAGIAGAAAAAILGRTGLRVVLVDPRAEVPALFRAEKIEPDQAALLRAHGLLDGLLPRSARIHRVDEARAGRLLRSVAIEQYGIFYRDLATGLRAAIPAGVDFRACKVVGTAEAEGRRTVHLDDGTEIRTRLVVVACGTGRSAQKVFGLSRQVINDPHSMAFGFSLRQVTAKGYPSEALTIFGDRVESGVDALSLFPIRETLRANLFTYWHPRDTRVRDLLSQPVAALERLLPGLSNLSGQLAPAGKVECYPITLDRVEGHRQAGLVVIGDAFQSVCPATGTGLSKVLTDVDRLTALLPDWLDGPEISAETVEALYADPRKTACDQNSLAMALKMRKTAIDPGLRWRLQRTARVVKKTLQACDARFRAA